jgi:hypothetical protein
MYDKGPATCRPFVVYQGMDARLRTPGMTDIGGHARWTTLKSSFPRRRESKLTEKKWIPVYTGMTKDMSLPVPCGGRRWQCCCAVFSTRPGMTFRLTMCSRLCFDNVARYPSILRDRLAQC